MIYARFKASDLSFASKKQPKPSSPEIRKKVSSSTGSFHSCARRNQFLWSRHSYHPNVEVTGTLGLLKIAKSRGLILSVKKVIGDMLAEGY